ncbi:hypothetical protein OAD33_05690 [Alphaproteobacteria bacterium]|jgi:hypothetical protein|nr:hypothetical protein [Alphaproteobacteria bacterium]|tara:strand:- start:124 stop:333 length:210 start_codon:yes stop_codon:yes gene_type:complete
MIKNMFLGPKKYWFALLMTAIIVFLPGYNHMHVSNFNLFILILFSISALLLFFILKTYKAGMQVTREKW